MMRQIFFAHLTVSSVLLKSKRPYWSQLLSVRLSLCIKGNHNIFIICTILPRLLQNNAIDRNVAIWSLNNTSKKLCHMRCVCATTIKQTNTAQWINVLNKYMYTEVYWHMHRCPGTDRNQWAHGISKTASYIFRHIKLCYLRMLLHDIINASY